MRVRFSLLPRVALRPVLAALCLLIATIGSSASAAPADLIHRSGFETPGALESGDRVPATDAVLPADALPEIGLRLASGSVTPTDWRLLIDGVDRTAASVATETSVMLTTSAPLPEGIHAVEIRAGASTVSWHFTTRTDPTITQLVPHGDLPPDQSRPTLSGTFEDIGSGIDPDSVRVLLDGYNVTDQAQITGSGFQLQPIADLADGEHVVSVELADHAGNAALDGARFLIGARPNIVFTQPAITSVSDGSTIEIIADLTISQGQIDPDSLEIRLNDQDVVSQTTLTPIVGGFRMRLVPTPPLTIGSHYVIANVASTAGATTRNHRQFRINDADDYTFAFVAPATGTPIMASSVSIELVAGSTLGPPTTVTINGGAPERVRPDGDLLRYSRIVMLAPGANTVTASATFGDATTRTITAELVHAPAADIRITAPLDWSIHGPAPAGPAFTPGGALDLTGAVQRPIVITGTTTHPVVSVQVNQQMAQLDSDGLGFMFPNFFLHEGTNQISAVATDAFGRTSSHQITVYVDQTAPILVVESPTDDWVTSQQAIDIRGVVNDAVEGRVGAAQPQVRVTNRMNGLHVNAEVSHLGFLAKGLALVVGRNVLDIAAIDTLGNLRTQSIDVVRTAVGASRLTLVSGHGQSGQARSDLPNPLVVQALDAHAMPLVNQTVAFDVIRGSGRILGPDGHRVRHLSLQTNDEGLASVRMQLGHDARPGSDVVRAHVAGQSKSVVFIASALPGNAAQIGVYGAAGTQYAATHSTPVEALMAQVLDAHGNPVADAAVEFRMVSGAGRFDALAPAVIGPEGQSITIRSDRHGVVAVRPITGGTVGTLIIRAEVINADGSRIGGASFQIETWAPRDGATSLSGVVMDHAGTRLAGIRLSIGRTPLAVMSDAEGFFRFEDQVPAGKVDLFIDGRGVLFQQGGESFEYPALHFETAIVQGQHNQLPHAIYLPPVSISRAVTVGGANDVVLTMPGFEGFEMIVRANSVTFPDGSRTGPLVVTAVHADRLPMVPPGTAGKFAAVGWTIQPTNTRFDPPIEVRIPNSDGLAPGRTMPIVQWDHDLAAFVPMGHGTVNETGTQIVSDPGSGITKAGWGGGGPPPPPPNDGDNQCPARCPAARGTPPTLTVTADGEETELWKPKVFYDFTEVAFSASVTSGDCPAPAVTWTLGDGTTRRGMAFTHYYDRAVDHQVTATLTCGSCCPGASDDVRVAIVRVEYKQSTACSGFDDTTTVPWLMVPHAETRTAELHVSPASVATEVGIESVATGTATVSPATASSSPQTLSVTGVATASADIETRIGTSANLGTLTVDVKNRIEKIVTIHAITERNDDPQLLGRGKGQRNGVCFRAGPNLLIESTATGDDAFVTGPSATGDYIVNGANGVCESVHAGDDVTVIPQNQGIPNTPCVGVGGNGFRDTPNKLGDDVIGAGDDQGIDSGANGICESEALHVSLSPQQVPNALVLEQFLNEQAWGKQANVYFKVHYRQASLNYDLDRDGALADPLLVAPNWAEVNVLSSVKDVLADYNVYYVKNYTHPVALANPARKETWIGDRKRTTTELATAHELGHLMGATHSTSPQDLMDESLNDHSGCRIRRRDWSRANP